MIPPGIPLLESWVRIRVLHLKEDIVMGLIGGDPPLYGVICKIFNCYNRYLFVIKFCGLKITTLTLLTYLLKKKSKNTFQ